MACKNQLGLMLLLCIYFWFRLYGASPKNDAYLGSQIIECDQRLNFKYPWKKFLFCTLHSAFLWMEQMYPLCPLVTHNPFLTFQFMKRIGGKYLVFNAEEDFRLEASEELI